MEATGRNATGERARRLPQFRSRRCVPDRLRRMAAASLPSIGACRGSSSTAAHAPVSAPASSPDGVLGGSSSSTSSTRATGRGGTWTSLSATGDLGRGLDGLLLLSPECLSPCADVSRGGVQKGSEQSRVRNSVGALQPAEELVTRSGELIRAKRGKLGVRQGPTSLPEALNGNSRGSEHESLNGLQLFANVGEAVGDLRKIGGAAVERAGLPL